MAKEAPVAIRSHQLPGAGELEERKHGQRQLDGQDDLVREGQPDRSQARSVWTAVWTFTEGHVGNFVPRRGRRTQPRVSTLGTDHPERCALKGRQIEPPN